MNTLEKYLTFTLGAELFAFPIESVREVHDVSEITRIPQTASFMLGVMNLRGNAVPVVDLKQKFNMGPTEHTINTRIAIIESKEGEKEILVGAMADSVREVLELGHEQIEPAPSMGMRVKADFIKGIARLKDKFIVLIDVHKVFSEQEMSVLEQANNTDLENIIQT